MACRSGAGADEVAATVERCPTGALRYERPDGAGGEVPHRPEDSGAAPTTVVAREHASLLLKRPDPDLPLRPPLTRRGRPGPGV